MQIQKKKSLKKFRYHEKQTDFLIRYLLTAYPDLAMYMIDHGIKIERHKNHVKIKVSVTQIFLLSILNNESFRYTIGNFFKKHMPLTFEIIKNEIEEEQEKEPVQSTFDW